MGKGSPSAPTPPDPSVTARAQGEMNINTARANAAMNRVGQTTPYGSLSYERDPRAAQWLDQRVAEDRQSHMDQGIEWGGEDNARGFLNKENPYADSWTSTTTLSPAEQRQLDMSNEATETYGRAALSQLRRAEGELSQRFQFDGGPYGDPQMGREAVEAAMFARMNPSLQQGRMGAENRLRNQGLTPGSEAWNNAIRDVNQQENDARLGVITQAGNEQSRLAGLRQQSLQEQLALRAQPVNEAAALLSGQQINMPQFQQTPQVQMQTPDYISAVGQQQAGQNAAFQAQTANANANRTGMYGLGTAAIGAAGTAAAAYLGGAVVI